MKAAESNNAPGLPEGAVIAVVGGGPAGAFCAMHLLRGAKALGRQIRVVIFERRWRLEPAAPTGPVGTWRGCNFCAGGISPRLIQALRDMQLEIPEEMIQGRIRSITIEGYWKNIELDVPEGRELLSVYRGSRPASRRDRQQSFDSFLLDQALKAGAQLVSGEVDSLRQGEGGKPWIGYHAGSTRGSLEADFVVLAAGVNQAVCVPGHRNPLLERLPELLPGYVAPKLRSALIFELQVDPQRCAALAGQLHFVEYGSRALRLEMCSLVPKRGFVTAVLVGGSIDAVTGWAQNAAILTQFLDLPHIRKLMVPGGILRVGCSCNPNMVVGTARHLVGNRMAVIGDLATSRLYKDGILSAHDTARALAEALLAGGLSTDRIQRGYMPAIRRLRRDNRFAAVVFFLHRVVFSSSVLSRVLYQAVITERKNLPQPQRRLERMLWQISSGDARYRDVLFDMVHPAIVWQILNWGVFLTFRNYVTEICFGLRWEGFGRFTTGVAKERLQTKRTELPRCMAQLGVALPVRPEFERMYTIKMLAPPELVMRQLGRFGEPDRRYLHPRGVRVERIAGTPNEPGCVIQYTVLSRRFNFHLRLEQIIPGRFALYRVEDGFARGGVLLFEIEGGAADTCALSIYVAFNFSRGRRRITRPFWALFRLLFPAWVHDVIWNHSLCVLKDVVETEYQAALGSEPAPVGKASVCRQPA